MQYIIYVIVGESYTHQWDNIQPVEPHKGKVRRQTDGETKLQILCSLTRAIV